MASLTASKQRFLLGAPLLLVAETDEPVNNEQLARWQLRLRDVRDRGLTLLQPGVLRLGESSFLLTATVPMVQSGLYSLTLTAASRIHSDLPLLLLERAVYANLAGSVAEEPFLEIQETPETIETGIIEAFRERTRQIGFYAPSIFEAVADLENIRFSSPVLGRLPSAPIFWVADTIADEYLYLGPLGIKAATCRLSVAAGRLQINLVLTLKNLSSDIVNYLADSSNDLSLIARSGKLVGFRAEVKMVNDDTVSLSAGFRLEGRDEGQSKASNPRNSGRLAEIAARTQKARRVEPEPETTKTPLRYAEFEVEES